MREEESNFVIAAVLTLIFLALAALLLWPLGKIMLAVSLAKGYVIFWSVAFLTALILDRLQRFFRIEIDTHFDAYVISNLAHSVILLLGWSAFAALTVGRFVADVPVWMAVILYFIGLVSSHNSYNILRAFYPGYIYTTISLSSALGGYAVFAVWPAAARFLFGWFFDLYWS